MTYRMRLGVPEMESLWNTLKQKMADGSAVKSERELYQKLGKTMKLLTENPRHPGLQSHEIDALTKRYGMKVWESYLENHTPAAGRVFWVYGPEKGEITIIGLEPHPNDKGNAYRKITLSDLGEISL